jgi:hypothetical protein
VFLRKATSLQQKPLQLRKEIRQNIAKTDIEQP